MILWWKRKKRPVLLFLQIQASDQSATTLQFETSQRTDNVVIADTQHYQMENK
jgi:fructoselysine-6-P-deglycase FrlB-like protein